MTWGRVFFVEVVSVSVVEGFYYSLVLVGLGSGWGCGLRGVVYAFCFRSDLLLLERGVVVAELVVGLFWVVVVMSGEVAPAVGLVAVLRQGLFSVEPAVAAVES